jgi:hypothetical protein
MSFSYKPTDRENANLPADLVKAITYERFRPLIQIEN